MTASRILIADDDFDLGQFLGNQLHTIGYEVSIVENGEDAIAQLRQQRFDLAIVDIRMPIIDGFGVLRHIREEKLPTKVVMLTAYADLKHYVMSKECGADEFLTKPYDFESLRGIIETLVQQE